MCFKLTVYLHSATYIKIKTKGKCAKPLIFIYICVYIYIYIYIYIQYRSDNKSAYAELVLDPNSIIITKCKVAKNKNLGIGFN